MSNIAICARDLGKRYQIGQPSLHSRLGVLLERLVRAPFQHGHGHLEPEHAAHLWALRHASFEVRRGEMVGLVGHNGAGKSVLLKLLARITRPTEGEAHIRGRVGSMLEVGAGFHPELTGRENIFLNGTIFGMGRSEVQDKFDDIVEFSGVSTFLDTPIKRYSSGMRARLAFAVAIHAETDILLVDEVLAVGDRHFRDQSLARLRALSAEGRTILFVSHNHDLLASLCDRALLLNGGQLTYDGPTKVVLERYERTLSSARPHQQLRRLSLLP